MSSKKTTPANGINIALSRAKNVQVGPDIYSNMQRATLTQNELFLDFYAISPDLEMKEKPQITHLQRIILPLFVAKDLARILNETTSGIEVEINDIESTEPELDSPDKKS